MARAAPGAPPALAYVTERTREEEIITMSINTQKPGEKPDHSGKHVEVGPDGKPVSPPNTEISKPGAGHLPPTKEPGHEWKEKPKDK
jgi:hypothetical protein